MRVARSARESQSVSRVVQVHVQVHTGNGRVVLEELETRGAGATRRTRSAKHVGSGDRLLASSELNERSASEGRVRACGKRAQRNSPACRTSNCCRSSASTSRRCMLLGHPLRPSSGSPGERAKRREKREPVEACERVVGHVQQQLTTGTLKLQPRSPFKSTPSSNHSGAGTPLDGSPVTMKV